MHTTLEQLASEDDPFPPLGVDENGQLLPRLTTADLLLAQPDAAGSRAGAAAGYGLAIPDGLKDPVTDLLPPVPAPPLLPGSLQKPHPPAHGHRTGQAGRAKNAPATTWRQAPAGPPGFVCRMARTGKPALAEVG
jgi:hypothetical protein